MSEPTWAEVIESLRCSDGEALYWDRIRGGVRLREMARRLGISPRTLSDLENDRTPVTPEIRERYAQALKRVSG